MDDNEKAFLISAIDVKLKRERKLAKSYSKNTKSRGYRKH